MESASVAESRKGTKRKAAGYTPVKGKRPLIYKMWNLSSFKEANANQKAVLKSVFSDSPWLLLDRDSSEYVCLPSLF
jgi:hypothetical protein